MHGRAEFPKHIFHVIEHSSSSYPADMRRVTPENMPEISAKKVLQVGVVCVACDLPTSRGDLQSVGINITFINELQLGSIDKWFAQYMAEDGWSEDRIVSTIANPSYGTGKLYIEVFQHFDVLVVSPKRGAKMEYGSIQRITSQMRSGTPVLVEREGGAFKRFLDQYNYSCVFSNGNNEYMTFDEALLLMRDVEFRRKCRREGLRISSEFSPAKIWMQFLRVLGYMGDCS